MMILFFYAMFRRFAEMMLILRYQPTFIFITPIAATMLNAATPFRFFSILICQPFACIFRVRLWARYFHFYAITSFAFDAADCWLFSFSLIFAWYAALRWCHFIASYYWWLGASTFLRLSVYFSPPRLIAADIIDISLLQCRHWWRFSIAAADGWYVSRQHAIRYFRCRFPLFLFADILIRYSVCCHLLIFNFVKRQYFSMVFHCCFQLLIITPHYLRRFSIRLLMIRYFRFDYSSRWYFACIFCDAIFALRWWLSKIIFAFQFFDTFDITLYYCYAADVILILLMLTLYASLAPLLFFEMLPPTPVATLTPYSFFRAEVWFGVVFRYNAIVDTIFRYCVSLIYWCATVISIFFYIIFLITWCPLPFSLFFMPPPLVRLLMSRRLAPARLLQRLMRQFRRVYLLLYAAALVSMPLLPPLSYG